VFHDKWSCRTSPPSTCCATAKAFERCDATVETYTRIALDRRVGIVLEAPTWRAERGLGRKTRLRRGTC
jgi:hypothetical protein